MNGGVEVMSEVKKPNISPETIKRMWQFFLRTSIPRLIEKDRQAAEEVDREERQTERKRLGGTSSDSSRIS